MKSKADSLNLVSISKTHTVIATKEGYAKRYSSVQAAKRRLKSLEEQGIAAYILGTDPIFIGILS
jgi:hypothetical protein